MQQITDILKQDNKLPTSQSNTLSRKVTNYSTELISRKYEAPAFGTLTDEQLNLTALKILLTVQAISGWQLPDKEILDILITQLTLKLKESYPKVNIKEVEYAFRNYSVKEYGKNFNLFIFDEVLEPYLRQRSEASKEEETKQPKQLPMQEITKEEKLQDIAEYRERTDLNENTIHLIPYYLHDWILELGLMEVSEAEKFELYDKATKLKLNQIYKAALEDTSKMKDYNKFKDSYDRNMFSDWEVEQIHYLYLKLVALKYFREWKQRKENLS